MKIKHALGYQNYEKMMNNHIFYVDKTDFIIEWWDNADEVTLVTRPRRFGKTLNMSTVECFFSNQYKEKGYLFEGKKVWENEEMRRLHGEFPVIFMSFARAKSGYDKASDEKTQIDSINAMKTAVKQIITDTYAKYKDIAKSELFDDKDRAYFASIRDDMDDKTAQTAVRRLCYYLEKYYKKRVIVLLDEYDTPMQEAWLYGYWDKAVAFFRSFFVNTFKDNESMERGLITGITRISKESIFSELNHLKVVTTTANKYALSFGFTEQEVFDALDDAGFGSEKETVKKWYDGFTFGKYTDIYNPWSIAAFMENDAKYEAYWANTSANSLVNSLIQRGNKAVKQTVEDLLAGKSFRARIDEQIVFNQLEGNEDAVWSLLLATGYLKVMDTESFAGDRENEPYYTLALTNREVRMMFKNMVRGWFSGDHVQTVYNDFIQAMLDDNVRMMNAFMNQVALRTFSSFDSGNKPSEEAEPERFYHGFVLGMVVNMADTYEVRSNRESGFGRYDVMLEPRDKNGKAFIFEFKVLNPYEDEKTLADTLAAAHRQIEEKKYETELIARGFAPERIRKYGFAFQGKQCLIG